VRLITRLVLDYTKNRTTPPTVPYIKSILKVIADMTKGNMKKTIDIAKGFYKRLRFIGLSADCWTNKNGRGFIGIEISFINFDTVTGKFVKTSMCLACVYLPGSHDAANIAGKVRTVLCSFGLTPEMVNIYVSDSGGGIPAAAKVLGITRRPCTLHSADTAVGWALGEKGNMPKSGVSENPRWLPGARDIHALNLKVKKQANVFTHASLLYEQYEASVAEVRAAGSALALITGGDTGAMLQARRLELNVLTRMWSWHQLYNSTFNQSMCVLGGGGVITPPFPFSCNRTQVPEAVLPRAPPRKRALIA
jgi:hypothetical protein